MSVPSRFALCGIVLPLASASALAGGANRPGRCGVVAHVTRDEFDTRHQAFAMMRDAGIDWVRCDFDWRTYQKAPNGPFDWETCDAVVDDAAAYGIQVLPILGCAPDWADPVQAHLPEWRSFLRATAEHFRGRISVYEIWNEENHPGFWKNPAPKAYATVLKAAAEEIRAADPQAKVLFGGTAGIDLPFIEGVYDAGAGASFDILNVHPYSWPNPPNALPLQMGDIRKMMARHGDAGKPLWITEIGWPTHRVSVPMTGVLRAGLKVARPDRAVWRIGVVDAKGDEEKAAAVASGLGEALGDFATVAGYTTAGLVAALAEARLDAVVYPYTEDFPQETFAAVAEFVRRGGVLVDFGGYPLYYPYAGGRRLGEGDAGALLAGDAAKRLRISVYGPDSENGLKYNGPTYATEAATQAGLKFEPNGFHAFRFFSDERLEDGDSMEPLLSVRDAKGREAASACVYRFASDWKGAVVVAGCNCASVGGASEQEQADYVVQALAAAEAVGVEKTFLYEFQAPEADPYYSEDHFGIVHKDFSPKPAYEALKAMGK